jgi:hypothetical protein
MLRYFPGAVHNGCAPEGTEPATHLSRRLPCGPGLAGCVLERVWRLGRRHRWGSAVPSTRDEALSARQSSNDGVSVILQCSCHSSPRLVELWQSLAQADERAEPEFIDVAASQISAGVRCGAPGNNSRTAARAVGAAGSAPSAASCTRRPTSSVGREHPQYSARHLARLMASIDAAIDVRSRALLVNIATTSTRLESGGQEFESLRARQVSQQKQDLARLC